MPEGSWLCRTCALGVQPKCLLCPKKGGAMKPTRSGTKWVHVSCALWIPEVSLVSNSNLVETILVFSWRWACGWEPRRQHQNCWAIHTSVLKLTPGSVGLWKGILEAAVAWATIGGVHKSSHLFISGNPLS